MQTASARVGVRMTPNSGAMSAGAGAITEEQFRTAFEATPKITITSYKDLTNECQKQAAILENLQNDWTKRIKALQMLRAVLKQMEPANYTNFAEQTYSLMGNALELSIKDLRSQVCREACITIAFYCMQLGIGYWRVVESILPITMILTQNSAKIMASSGQICNVFITKNVHHPKVLAIIVHNISHKAKEVRRMAIALVAIIINLWDSSLIERHSAELLQSVKSALNDADPEVRATARQAFENLQHHFPSKAESLFQELDPAKQRMLTGRSSTASSTHSINSERDNLPNPNRGLYSVQNAFLNKRSASDLNHSVRRLNLNQPRVVRPVNKFGRPPQVSPSANSISLQTPSTHKIAPSTPHAPKIAPPTQKIVAPTTHKFMPTTPTGNKNAMLSTTPSSIGRKHVGAPSIPLNVIRMPKTNNNNISPNYVSKSTSQPGSCSNSPTPIGNGYDQNVQSELLFLNQDADDQTVDNSLRAFTQVIREKGTAFWDENFNDIFFAIQRIISNPHSEFITTKIAALKALKEICIAQPRRLMTKTDWLLLNVLNAQESDDATVVRAADDCAATLAHKLPTDTCMNILLEVIDSKKSKYQQLSGAIKMLGHLISKLPPDEIEEHLPMVASHMTRCYENSQSMVRRASIICLAQISNAIGIQFLRPHLDQSTLKLVEVYANRLTTKKDGS